MRRHNILRSYVAQYEMVSGNDNCLDAVPVHAVAALNTHDMHPFAAFWQGIDIEEREVCGVLSRDQAAREADRRVSGREALLRCLYRRKLIVGPAPAPAEIYRAVCRVLALSDAEVLLLNIDDLAGSTKAHNIPGTCYEHPNRRRRTDQPLEQLENNPDIASFLQEIDTKRKQ